MLIKQLVKSKLITVPSWFKSNIIMLSRMGSEIYGANLDDSDVDIYGLVIPPLHHIYPHLDGHIYGFGQTPQIFNTYTQHHIKFENKQYDITIYSIVKFFDMMLSSNPTLINFLFVPQQYIIYNTPIGEYIIRHRDLFLSKQCKHKFCGYAFSQLNKIQNKKYHDNPIRQSDIQKHGYDTKHGYHLVRMLLECQQILREGTLDVQRNSDILIQIRNGEWSLDRLLDWADESKQIINDLYNTSSLPNDLDKVAIKKLLVDCIDMFYDKEEYKNMSNNVINDIIKERNHQIMDEGFDEDHDDYYDRSELILAAACYILNNVSENAPLHTRNQAENAIVACWPWHKDWWKSTDNRRDLIKAAALIVAEIERIDRKGVSQ